jgi:PAS domain S-box-containing protein
MKWANRLFIAAGAFILYILVYWVFHSLTGSRLIALVILPIAISGWLFGPLGGIAAALFGGGLNLLLLHSVGWLDWQHLFMSNALTGFLIVTIMGFLMGTISRLDQRVNREFKERVKAEENQKATLSLLRATLDTSVDGILATNLAGDVVLHNRQFSEMWKMDPEKLINASLLRDERFLKNRVKQPQECSDRLQHIYAYPDLEHHYQVSLLDDKELRCHAMPQREDGKTQGIVFSFQDISDLKQKQDALYESEQKLRGLIDHSAEGILLLDEQGNVLEWNEAMEGISGLKWEDVFNRSMAEVSYFMMPPAQRTPEVLAKARVTLKEMLQTGQNPSGASYQETIIRRSNGKRSVVEITSFPIKTEKGFMIGAFYRDITERKQAEDALRKQTELAQTILNAYPDMASLVDTSGKVLGANQALIEAVGDGLIGADIVELLPQAIRFEVKFVLDEVMRSGKPYHADSQGPEQYFFLTVYPIFDDTGTVNRMALFVRDITESRQRERELEAVASISSALRAALSREEVYPIILDQVERLLNADGIGLIVRDIATGEVKVEQARGAWISLLNMRYSADQATRGPILIMHEPYLNNNIESEQHLFQTKPFSGLKATACVPLEIEGENIGSLWIGRKSTITKEDVRILSALAHITASATHRAALYERTRLYAEQVTNAAEIGRTLSETLLPGQIYHQLAHSLLKLLPNVCTVMISRYDASARTFACVYALQDGKIINTMDLPSLGLLEAGESSLSEVIQTSQPLVVNNFHHSLKRKGSSKVGTGDVNARSALFVPLISKREVLGVLQVHSNSNHRFKPADVELLTLVGNTAAIAIQNAGLFDNLQQSHAELSQAYEATLDGWARALDLRDHGTHGHSRRVVELTVELGRSMGLKDEDLVHLRRGAWLHDIGKMGVPDDILKKTGPLTNEEWIDMRNHTTNAYQWLSPISFLKPALDIPYSHHEKWDGSGYPQRLAGEQIPLAARIFAVVDVWDALHSNRPYRPAWTTEKVVEYLREQRGKHFDPHVVDAFLRMVVVSE